LEGFFIEVVEKARREATEATGAGPSAGVAQYLAGPGVLERLTEDRQQPIADSQAKPEPTAEEKKRAADEKLSRLMKPGA
jgi:hypothetical protein